jgi:hypothetical protein
MKLTAARRAALFSALRGGSPPHYGCGKRPWEHLREQGYISYSGYGSGRWGPSVTVTREGYELAEQILNEEFRRSSSRWLRLAATRENLSAFASNASDEHEQT